uniref:Cytochrome c oxidase subunit 2 n=1 Tax=Ceriantheopsis americana TaxID=37515 RepID=I7CEC2_9CNID|nr:cytochrome c oxidase subunit II [Ceriantheopsis americana]
MPESFQYMFQNAGSPLMEEVSLLHNQIMLILIIIIFMVLWLIIKALFNKVYYQFLTDGALVEIVWTTIPAVILLFIAFPSLKLWYIMDEVMDPVLTIKAVGHQWYWSYEYYDCFFETLEFDSYMIPTSSLNSGDLRLLEVDNRLILPVNTAIRALITGDDVLHSFTLPSLAIKTDAIPGRLNQVSFFIKRTGVFYGQCSEICGANHSFMPIIVQGTSIHSYFIWLNSFNQETTDPIIRAT